MICCTCEISGRLSSFRSHGVKNRFLKQEIVIEMRKCAISVRTQILLHVSLHNVNPKTSLLYCKDTKILFLTTLKATAVLSNQPNTRCYPSCNTVHCMCA